METITFIVCSTFRKTKSRRLWTVHDTWGKQEEHRKIWL